MRVFAAQCIVRQSFTCTVFSRTHFTILPNDTIWTVCTGNKAWEQHFPADTRPAIYAWLTDTTDPEQKEQDLQELQWFMDELQAAEQEQLRVLPHLLGKELADKLRLGAIRDSFHCSRHRNLDDASLSRSSSAARSRRTTVELPIDPKASFKLRRRSSHSPRSTTQGEEEDGSEQGGDANADEIGADSRLLRVSRQFVAPDKERRQPYSVHLARFANALLNEIVGGQRDRGGARCPAERASITGRCFGRVGSGWPLIDDPFVLSEQGR